MSGLQNTDSRGERRAGQSVFLQRIVAEANRRLRKNAVGLLNENINPLWNIDERRAQQIYDFARSGNYAQIQYLYNEIEERDPTLLVCVTRRTSAVAELDWRVVRSNERLNRRADKNLVAEQIECVETAIARIDNMPDALEHLALSAFRGFAAVAPERNERGEIAHLNLIDNWNLCFDKAGQSWYFNPTASAFMMPTSMGMDVGGADGNTKHGLQRIPAEDLCVVVRKREIDWPAMQIYLRAAVGERDWGRFLETYGLPPVIITMPEFTSKDEQAAYIQAAEDVFEGRSGVVPFGSEVNYASESRGTNPFTEFIEHQQKLVVMMATGGTLATLAESGSGTLAGDAQQDEWNRIIRADKRIISNAINKQICERIVRSCADFKGQPVLAEFQLDDTPKPTPRRSCPNCRNCPRRSPPRSPKSRSPQTTTAGRTTESPTTRPQRRLTARASSRRTTTPPRFRRRIRRISRRCARTAKKRIWRRMPRAARNRRRRKRTRQRRSPSDSSSSRRFRRTSSR